MYSPLSGGPPDDLALDLMQKMLAFHPKDRISVEEALKHPFFEDVRDECNNHVAASLGFRTGEYVVYGGKWL